MQEVSICFFIY